MNSPTDVFGPASDFTRKTLACLYDSKGVKHVHQCSGYWADGYIETDDGEKIPFEIKDTLGWGKLSEALVQLVSIHHALPPMGKRAWIIFQNYSAAWTRNPNGALNHAIYCASKFHTGIDIYLLQLNHECNINPILAAPGAASPVLKT